MEIVFRPAIVSRGVTAKGLTEHVDFEAQQNRIVLGIFEEASGASRRKRAMRTAVNRQKAQDYD